MAVELVLAVVLAVLLVLVALALRRLQQLRRGGVDVSLRAVRDPAAERDDGRGWHTGVGRYRGDQFRWFRVSGLGSSPTVVLDRTEVEILDRRPATVGELHQRGASVLLCRTRRGLWEVAMAPDVLTGFSSWLESTPPGRSTGYRQAS